MILVLIYSNRTNEVGHMAEVLLGRLTRREFRERMGTGELAGCIIPVAAIEQHLEHLAMEHDWRTVRYIAAKVAEDLSPHVLVAEGLMAGISEHHMMHAGTLSLGPGAFLAVLNDLIRSVIHAGFENVLVLNGHGGNVAACTSIWNQFLLRHRINLQFLSYWDVLSEDDAKQLLQSGHRIPYDMPGHAQEFETSFALAVYPENVRLEYLNDQTDTTPSLSSSDTGTDFHDRIIQRVTWHMSDMIDGRNVIEIPPYHV